MKKLIKYLPIILLVGLGLFLRIYKPIAFFYYTHDNDLASWVIKDVLVNHHFRLVGQQTSVLGVFIGGLFYYLQIPFYLLGKMDPKYVVYLPALIGTFATFSFYYVFSKIFEKKVGIIAGLIYATSFFIAFTDRQVFPTMPVMCWTAWYLYDLHLIRKGEQKKGFILFAILFALIWHMNIALFIITPLVIFAWIFSKKKIQWKYLLIGGVLLVALSSPLFVFEVKHDFQQTKAVFSSLTTQKNHIPGTSTGWAKLDRTIQLINTNTRNLIFPGVSRISVKLALYLLITTFVYLLSLKKISREWALIFFLWQILYIFFFSINALNTSEYYLDGMNVVWIGIVSIFLTDIYKKKYLKWITMVVITVYCGWNIYQVVTAPVITNGYAAKKAITEYIKNDSLEHNYPCISISYITAPGYNLGYRYFFYIEDMHVNQPDSGSPVYTIVFPLSLVNGFDKRFGDLGLILPDYKKYNQETVNVSCQGANSNLTDPMFGYTE